MHIAITQRVENNVSYKERRDCLDQRWAAVATTLSAILFPLPNRAPNTVEETLKAIKPDIIILSGGNSITALDETATDAAPERDIFETALLEIAIVKRIPVLGVCRGMQMINLHFGGNLQVVSNHIATRHELKRHSDIEFEEDVNSFHKWGLYEKDMARGFKPLASAPDGTIESFQHSTHNITGIMWHPEREETFSLNDINLIKRLSKS